MTLSKELTTMIIFSWFAGVLFFLYAVYQTITALSMKARAYRFGWAIVKVTEPFTFYPGKFTQNETGETGKCKFKFISSQDCIFREKVQLSDLLRESVNPINGAVTFENGKASMEGRIPVGPIGFLLAFILGTLAIEAKAILQGGGALFPAALGLLIVAAAVYEYFILKNQRDRFLIAYAEIKDVISKKAGSGSNG